METTENNLKRGTFPAHSLPKNVSTNPEPIELKTSRKEKKMVPPDGGWGWVVVFGGFFITALCTFSLFGFGIIFLPLLSSFNASSAKIAWIFNIHRLVWSTFALMIGPLNEQFGWRKLAMFAGILNSLSLILSSFAPSPDFLFFSYSLLGGIGGVISITVSIIVVSKYFEKHRGFAIGIASLGTCASSFTSPLISNYLIQNYGYTGASWIFGAIVLNQCVGAALLQPLEWHMKPNEICNTGNEEDNSSNLNEIPQDKVALQESQINNIFFKRERELSVYSVCSLESFHHSVLDSTLTNKNNICKSMKSSNEGFITVLKKVLKSSYYNLTLLKCHKMIIIALSSGCFTMGYINFQLWIPFVVTNAEYSLEVAAWCVSAASISNVVGRVLISTVSDRKYFNVTYGHMTGLFIMAISVIAFSFSRDITFFMIFVCCWGFGTGVAGSSNANNMIEIMGLELFPATYGIAALFRGVFSVIFGPLAGIVRDETSSYTYALCLLGGLTMVGVFLYLFLPLAERHDRRKDFIQKLQNLEESLK